MATSVRECVKIEQAGCGVARSSSYPKIKVQRGGNVSIYLCPRDSRAAASGCELARASLELRVGLTRHKCAYLYQDRVLDTVALEFLAFCFRAARRYRSPSSPTHLSFFLSFFLSFARRHVLDDHFRRRDVPRYPVFSFFLFLFKLLSLLLFSSSSSYRSMRASRDFVKHSHVEFHFWISRLKLRARDH